MFLKINLPPFFAFLCPSFFVFLLPFLHHQERGYTILVFARDQKKRNNVTVPFTYLGPVDMVSYESDRPIKMVWRLRYPMPVEMFEDNRRGG